MKIRLIISCLLALSLQLKAEVYYVRVDGNDKNPGTSNSPGAAWQTMDHAIGQLKAGDHLRVDDGVYLTKSLWLKGIQGSPNRLTTIAAINPWKAVLMQSTFPDDTLSVLTISNSSYVVIDGFEVYDKVDTGIGITVRNGSHHVTIKNCYVHDCGCNGISSRLSDYVTIENNVVRGNSKRNEWNCSGISIWHPVELDREEGYHIIIRRNVAFENECNLPFRPLGFDNPTDGNGIIVDDFRNTQGGGQEGGYTSQVLVENNLSFNNGGRGFNVFQADNVTLRNNTSYHNLRIISEYADFPGEMTLSNSTSCRLYNNLIVKNPQVRTKALRSYDNDGMNTKIHHNIIVGPEDLCGQTVFFENNTLLDVSEQDAPAFANPSLEVEFQFIEDFRKYFGIHKSSVARNAAFNEDAPPVDRDGLPRPVKKKPDAGCYEWQEGGRVIVLSIFFTLFWRWHRECFGWKYKGYDLLPWLLNKWDCLIVLSVILFFLLPSSRIQKSLPLDPTKIFSSATSAELHMSILSSCVHKESPFSASIP